MLDVIISPYSSKLVKERDDIDIDKNPKNYNNWQEIINQLKKHNINIIQVGVNGEKVFENVDKVSFNLNFKELRELLNKCVTWVSVDNFFHHFANCYKKKGIVLFNRSNPKLFGHDSNINLYKDKKYFREDQYGYWWNCEYLEESNIDPNIVVQKILDVVQEQILAKISPEKMTKFNESMIKTSEFRLKTERERHDYYHSDEWRKLINTPMTI